MSSIKKHLRNIEVEIFKLIQNGHVTEPDEFVAMSDVEATVNQARKVFERTKNINGTVTSMKELVNGSGIS